MRKCCCPVCEAPFPFWKTLLNRGDSFRLRRTVSVFRCPTCGTCLVWSIGRWIPVDCALYFIWIAGFNGILFLSDRSLGARMLLSVYFGLAMTAVLILFKLSVMQPVVCDETDIDTE